MLVCTCQRRDKTSHKDLLYSNIPYIYVTIINIPCSAHVTTTGATSCAAPQHIGHVVGTQR